MKGKSLSIFAKNILCGGRVRHFEGGNDTARKKICQVKESIMPYNDLSKNSHAPRGASLHKISYVRTGRQVGGKVGGGCFLQPREHLPSFRGHCCHCIFLRITVLVAALMI